jgi:hypothetical protein
MDNLLIDERLCVHLEGAAVHTIRIEPGYILEGMLLIITGVQDWMFQSLLSHRRMHTSALTAAVQQLIKTTMQPGSTPRTAAHSHTARRC